ncbi:hypothetical protein B296_00008237 [Ensete ventricosum]|uniref:Uncharacterized protein n=1 Tax=Ensete ventricosum TaxID=4639 RepID=A0A426YY36_ENSVE|nr:hypothetical protein B296_00008237 [Ensete ventricosum]
MASVDLIGAKLEALKMRIEDILRALFAEFILGRSPSPMRLLQVESPNQKENPLDKEEHAMEPTSICMRRPSAPSTTSRSPQPKKLLREELHDRYAKGLCWHCDKLWSHDHHCKKERLLMIEPIEHEEGDLEHEENVKEDL